VGQLVRILDALLADALRIALGGLLVMVLLPLVGGAAIGFLASVLTFALLLALVGVIRADR
jgi:hypothetical protein